jgi:hypothetical protein
MAALMIAALSRLRAIMPQASTSSKMKWHAAM